MAEPAPEEKPEGAPEWMVSYADMITIMMSFFVIMFALSSKKDEKAQQATAASFEYRFGPAWRPFGQIGPGLLPRGTQRTPAGDKKGRGMMFGAKPGGDIDDEKAAASPSLRIRIPGHGDRIDVGGVVEFDESSDRLSQRETDRLRAIAEEVAGKPQKIEILGHTTKRPMPPNSPYKDHWDLAYARCRSAMQQLVSMGIDPKRIRIGVAGSNEPAYQGDAPEMVKRNARVDIYLLEAIAEDANREK